MILVFTCFLFVFLHSITMSYIVVLSCIVCVTQQLVNWQHWFAPELMTCSQAANTLLQPISTTPGTNCNCRTHWSISCKGWNFVVHLMFAHSEFCLLSCSGLCSIGLYIFLWFEPIALLKMLTTLVEDILCLLAPSQIWSAISSD